MLTALLLVSLEATEVKVPYTDLLEFSLRITKILIVFEVTAWIIMFFCFVRLALAYGIYLILFF